MKILEQFCQPQHPGRPNEDALVITDNIAGVIDGVSGVPGQPTIEDQTLGQRAANIVATAAKGITPDETAHHFVARVTAALATERQNHHLAPTARLAAAIALYNGYRQEIWCVADPHAGFLDVKNQWLSTHQGGLAFDDTALKFRAMAIEMELEAYRQTHGHEATGQALGTIAQTGRAAVNGVISKQMFFANNAQHPYGYGVLNGMLVPDKLVKVLPLPKGTVKVVLATDGFPLLAPTLAEAQQYIEELRTRDPLTIGHNQWEFCGFKGFVTEDGGLRTFYDDASYLSLEP